MSTQAFSHRLNSEETTALHSEDRRGFDLLRGECEGSCDSCSLPLRDRGAFRVPTVPEKFCSILCIECGLFSGHGRCRWCGEELDSNRGFFCFEGCRKQAEGVKFGNGTRLLNYLETRRPELYRKIAGQSGCLNCGGSLAGLRAGAQYCSDACRKASSRTARES